MQPSPPSHRYWSLGGAALGLMAVAGVFAILAGRDAGPVPASAAQAEATGITAYPAGSICSARSERDGPSLVAAAPSGVSPMSRDAGDPDTAFADTDPPLWDGLGTLTFDIATASEEAQQYFDQGIRLAFAFNHAEAQRAFRQAQRLEPGCAMCYWGEALVLGPNINMPMAADAVGPALAALSKAQSLADSAGARGQALIAALAARYDDDPGADRAALDAAYAEAMGRVTAQFPEDLNIAVLHAESLMDLSPWDYWQPGGREPNPQSAAIVPTLERVLAKDPDHPGAIHFYIHAVEASDRPERAEPFADRLRGAMPGAGHLVHMPSHIYYRVGRYRDALDVNIDAAAADERYLEASNAPLGVYRLGYYPHNVHFVMAAAQMSGDGRTVIGAAEKLTALVPAAAARQFAIVQPVKAAPYLAHARFSPPETILALPDPGDEIPYVKALWHYARGIARVAEDNLTAAVAEADAIAGIADTADMSGLAAAGIPAKDVLAIAQHVVHARVLQARADFAGAADRFERAADLQDRLPYMEPPYWNYPLRQSLGAVLLQAGRHKDAEAQFQLSLDRAPNNAWAYYGLQELYKSTGDVARAKEAEETFRSNWTGSPASVDLSRL